MSQNSGDGDNSGDRIVGEHRAASSGITLQGTHRDLDQEVRKLTNSIDEPQPAQKPHIHPEAVSRKTSSRKWAHEHDSSLRRLSAEKDVHASSERYVSELQNASASAICRPPKNWPGRDAANGSSAWIQHTFGLKERFNLPSFPRLQRWRIEVQHKVRKIILRIPDVIRSKDGRHIFINEDNLLDERTGAPYINNSIRSSRYSLLSFFPRQLFAQFSKLANLYFLVIGIMQMVPGLSTTGRFTTIVPLLVFVGISMAKEGWDDLRRWKLDQEENSRRAHVLVEDPAGSPPVSESSLSISHSWVAKQWFDIRVGDIVQLVRDDPVPADMILLYAEGDSAYMETMALDGETSLKNKQPPATLLKSCKNLEDVTSCRGEVVVEDPSIDLYRFEGKISIAETSLPLTTAEVLHRGSTLRNTPTAVGIVCYSGEECRIRQNANKNPRIKAPALQGLVNRIVIIIATFVLLLSLGCTFGYKVWDSYEYNAWYLQGAGVYWGYVLTSFIIMYNTLLPLSLYVSMEIVKLIQVWLMSVDLDLYDSDSGTPMQCQTSTINEELGQVSYIFSDKTGTLTRNEMKIRKLSCGGYIWNHDRDLDGRTNGAKYTTTDQSAALTKSGDSTRLPHPSSIAATNRRKSIETPPDIESLPTEHSAAHIPYNGQSDSRRAASLVAYIYQHPSSHMANRARSFILSIALCHTCLPEREQQSEEIKYQATSPDELALVLAAQEMGYIMIDRRNGKITIKTYPNGKELDPIFETFEILQVIEFTSTRKRMSVIVKEPNGQICVHCKGADTVISTLLRLSDWAAVQMKSVDKRTRERRSLEAQDVLQRRSSALSAGRPSFEWTGLKRRSSTAPQRGTSLDNIGEKWPGLSAGWNKTLNPSSDSLPRPRSRHQSIRESRPPRERDRSTSVEDGVGMRAKTPSGMPELNAAVKDALVTDEAWVMEQTFEHVNHFANEGLRTLLHAARYLSEEEYIEWAKAYSEATTALSDRERRISDTANLIERQFELIGATAIEDRLQDGVPDAIDRLRRANIKLWMLTGDKRETAISISRSCRLTKDYSTIMLLDHTAGSVSAQMSNAVLDISHGTVAHGVLVLDGETLASIHQDDEQQASFLELAVLADSVICCRASPSQKAILVKSIRHHVKGAITLAIGDGANDVAMIQEADVGIGISGGKEGLQAARTSDYAIAQFRFLCKLLLVHGRYNYDRISKYILATTYKEMVFYMTQALYQRYNGYTGTSLYENWSLAWYNAAFTSLPVIFLGAFMADLSPSTLLAVPQLYTKGQRRGSFNFTLWLWWTFLASAEAMLVYFAMYGIYAKTPFTLDKGLYAMGVLTYTASVMIVNVKLQVLEVHNKNVLVVIAIVLSLGAWFTWNLLISGVYGNTAIYNVKSGFLERFGQNALWWLTLIVIVLAFVLFELAIKSVKATFFPSDVNVFQVLEKDPVMRRRFELSAAPLLHLAESGADLDQTVDEKNKRNSERKNKSKDESVLGIEDRVEKEESAEPGVSPGRSE